MGDVQCHAPTSPLSDLTSRAFSTYARLAIARLNVTMIGMPTPTVSFGIGVTSLMLNVCVAFCSVNWLAALIVLPLAFFAVALTE